MSNYGKLLTDIFFLNHQSLMQRKNIITQLHNSLHCPSCHRTFHKPLGLRKHLMTVHNATPTEMVDIARLYYSSLNNRKKRKRKQAPDRFGIRKKSKLTLSDILDPDGSSDEDFTVGKDLRRKLKKIDSREKYPKRTGTKRKQDEHVEKNDDDSRFKPAKRSSGKTSKTQVVEIDLSDSETTTHVDVETVLSEYESSVELSESESSDSESEVDEDPDYDTMMMKVEARLNMNRCQTRLVDFVRGNRVAALEAKHKVRIKGIPQPQVIHAEKVEEEEEIVLLDSSDDENEEKKSMKKFDIKMAVKSMLLDVFNSVSSSRHTKEISDAKGPEKNVSEQDLNFIKDILVENVIHEAVAQSELRWDLKNKIAIEMKPKSNEKKDEFVSQSKLEPDRDLERIMEHKLEKKTAGNSNPKKCPSLAGSPSSEMGKETLNSHDSEISSEKREGKCIAEELLQETLDSVVDKQKTVELHFRPDADKNKELECVQDKYELANQIVEEEIETEDNLEKGTEAVKDIIEVDCEEVNKTANDFRPNQRENESNKFNSEILDSPLEKTKTVEKQKRVHDIINKSNRNKKKRKEDEINDNVEFENSEESDIEIIESAEDTEEVEQPLVPAVKKRRDFSIVDVDKLLQRKVSLVPVSALRRLKHRNPAKAKDVDDVICID